MISDGVVSSYQPASELQVEGYDHDGDSCCQTRDEDRDSNWSVQRSPPAGSGRVNLKLPAHVVQTVHWQHLESRTLGS
jgi:hypothetical protein